MTMSKFEELANEFIETFQSEQFNTNYDYFKNQLNTYEWKNVVDLVSDNFRTPLVDAVTYTLERLATEYQEKLNSAILKEYRQFVIDILISYIELKGLENNECKWHSVAT
ncbi:hypothetical protein [Staphylococcus capitis]|uniref:hypothetical protein n=1 Tax=Staphylococcus capitis TaxID=29388 RepID=UPI001B7D5D64|nr:hypothetical protein [Staphylococcus capitis]